MPTQLLAVARNAFLESIRQPFYLVWLCVVGFLVALNPYLSAYTFEDDDKLATDMGLSMLLVGSLVLAAFAASGVLSREIENRTVLTVMTKPLPRPLFVVGKYAGVAAAVGLAWWVWGNLHLLAIRQGAFSTVRDPWDLPVLIFGTLAILAALGVAAGANYFFGRHFGALFARWLAVLLPAAILAALPFDARFGLASPGETLPVPLLLAIFFILQAGLLFAAIAVACSTRLGQVATLSVLLVVFFMGLTSDYAFGEGAERGRAASGVLYAVIPNLQFHWLSDALTQETAGGITAGFVLMVCAYTLCLIVGVLALAIALFQTRSTA